jgi:hypothetical protein
MRRRLCSTSWILLVNGKHSLQMQTNDDFAKIPWRDSFRQNEHGADNATKSDSVARELEHSRQMNTFPGPSTSGVDFCSQNEQDFGSRLGNHLFSQPMFPSHNEKLTSRGPLLTVYHETP